MNPKVCFVIAPIGEENSEIRKRSDQVLNYIIKPCCEKYSYDVLRADKISEPGLITTQIIEHIINDELVIADLTGKNPNVFYELAIRHASGKPVVQLIEKGEVIPFDVGGIRTIYVDIHDIDSISVAKQQLIENIKNIYKKDILYETPITIAKDLTNFKSTGDKGSKHIADLLNITRELKLELSHLSQKFDNLKHHIYETPALKPDIYYATLQILLNKGDSLGKRAIEKKDKELAAYAQSIIEHVKTLMKYIQ